MNKNTSNSNINNSFQSNGCVITISTQFGRTAVSVFKNQKLLDKNVGADRKQMVDWAKRRAAIS